MNFDGAPVTVFINYRKAEATVWARLLYDRLAAELGPDNVFLDQVSLEPGVEWLQGIRSRSSSCTAFIALIGPKWAEALTDRVERGEQDYVRSEIETALEEGSRVKEVIPVLIDGAATPSRDDLRYVGSVRPLFSHQQIELSTAQLDDDVRALIEELKTVEEPAPEPEPSLPPQPSPKAPSGEEPVAPPPGRDHYDELVHLMLEEDSPLVPFLGPGANSCDRTEPWRDTESAYLPDAEELAAYLAERLGIKPTPASLALVSQSLWIDKGPGDLFKALQQALPQGRQPSSVHRFLAGLPAKLSSLGAPDPYQLIVTTNYDNALEQAFEDAKAGYDLAVYIARGRDKGRFVHVPNTGEPQLILNPNSYTGFPINAFGRVERTTILKVHGAVDRAQGPLGWKNNYVITEDDYIDYMSDGEIESIVPQQLLGKLRDYSHLLFLGHEMHDWSLRVFLMRIFGDTGLSNTSWAVKRDPTRLDERFWQKIKADLVAISPDEYVRELDEHLTRVAAAGQPQG